MHGLSLSISTLLLALLLVAGGSSHAVALAIQQTQQRSFLGQMLGLSTGGDVLSPSTTLVSPDSVPVEMCPGVSGSFSLESVRTVPDTPQRGQKLRVEVRGTLRTDVSTGTMVDVRVKYRRIPLLTKRLDLCTELSKDQSLPEHCPIAAGPKLWVYEVDLPQEIPPGQYTVDLRIRDQSQHDVVCLKVMATF